MLNRKYVICEPEDLRTLCVDKDWFTCGSIKQYDKLFAMNEDETILKSDLSDATDYMLCEMATVIWVCSDDSYTFAEIYEELKERQKQYYSDLVKYATKGITIPTRTKFLEVAKDIPFTGGNRIWTRTIGYGFNAVCAVWNSPQSTGYEEYPVFQEAGIRPVLILDDNLDIPLYKSFSFGGYDWTMFDENLAICDKILTTSVFKHDDRAHAAEYEDSDVRNYVESWYIGVRKKLDGED